MKAPKNIGVSVRDRLTQRARERRENAQLLMTRYAKRPLSGISLPLETRRVDLRPILGRCKAALEREGYGVE